MTVYRLALLTCLLALAGALQSGGTPASYGPFNGYFIHDGVGLKKTISAEGAPLKGDRPWTLYCWVKADDLLTGRTLLAGFGEPDAAAGAQRYLAARDGKLSFRAGGADSSGGAEVRTDAPLRPGAWQLVAATFDGRELRLYSDGAEVASGKLQLSDAAPVIQLAPVPLPGAGAAHFAGRIAGLTLVPRALTAEEVRALMSRARHLDLTPFEAASKTWPVQTKGQAGLRAPQDADTLPAMPAERPRAQARPMTNNEPRLEPRGANEWVLAGGWRLIEAPKTGAAASDISRPGFDSKDWMDAVVPGTVLSTLVERGVYPDPDFGLNNLFIPETLNKQDYWYRTEFRPPASLAGWRFRLTLHGVNYAASVWLNGRQLGDVRGAFARGEFDVSSLVVPGRANALAVRVTPPPHPGIPHEESVKAGPGPNGGIMALDGPTFYCTEGWDWIPGVRDRATGIWQEVTLKATGAVRVGDVQVVTDLPLPDLTRASVNINVPLRNDTGRAAAGVLEASFEGVSVRRRVAVQPGGMELKLTPAEFPQLNVRNPRLWWPNGYGSAELYHLNVKFTTPAGAESDSTSLRFGVRELSYELTLLDGGGRLRRVEFNPTAAAGEHVVNVSHEGIIESAEGWVTSFMHGREGSSAVAKLEDLRASPHLVLRVNGVRVAARGGNWGLDDSRKRIGRERLEPYFRLHREAGLNMIRNWMGQSYSEAFFDLADEYGLLVWNDFWLSTQDWNLEPTDTALFLANAREVITRFRNHPSVAIWCGRNEGVPPPTINEGLDELVRALDGTRYYTPNSRDVNLQGSGPWHYGEPLKFFTTRGRGFSTELGLPSVPNADTLRAMLPPEDLWPPGDAWAYHDWHSKSGGDINHFMKALEDELGSPTDLEDFERKAQLLNYESHRAMFEGFNANLWNPNTGRLMWMSHPAWPSTEWQMYASDYSADGAYYGVKKACEPVHVQLNLPDLQTAVVNTTRLARANLTLTARALSVKGEELFARESTVSAPADDIARGFRVELPGGTTRGVAFIKLELKDESGRVLSENFYWHAPQPSGYRALNELPAADVSASALRYAVKAGARVEAELTNRGASVALAVGVTLRDAANGARLLPAYASDNYISLLPGETRRVSIETTATPAGRDLQVELKGWNVRTTAVPVRPAR
ncbi:MAG TPA: LamG-like jellyroll fold domain-containing protein [Pyrinomonadaceae bacterium]|nr:LamG-like jellyroll fold domain-containing protein [Pyrinomonadaceae bacterium]